jgi:hypothetical protein
MKRRSGWKVFTFKEGEAGGGSNADHVIQRDGTVEYWFRVEAAPPSLPEALLPGDADRYHRQRLRWHDDQEVLDQVWNETHRRGDTALTIEIRKLVYRHPDKTFVPLRPYLEELVAPCIVEVTEAGITWQTRSGTLRDTSWKTIENTVSTMHSKMAAKAIG